MAKQVDLNMIRSRDKPIALAISVIATVTLIASMGVITSINEHSVKAQMMMGHQWKLIRNGTINLNQTIFQAIHSKASTPLTQAMTTTANQTIFDSIRSKIHMPLTQAMTSAERSVGNNSFALAAFGADQGGYFTYEIIIGTPAMKFYNVVVDPGNGQMLAKQEVSQNELQKMHIEHSAEMVRSGGSPIGFPFVIPH